MEDNNNRGPMMTHGGECLQQTWRRVLLPASAHGDGARRGVVASRGHDIGEGDHVVLRVSASVLPADGAAQLRGPLLHTHTIT